MFRSLIDKEKKEQRETVRVGVFICHCGHNIAGYVDVPGLVESARTLPNVVFVQDNLFSCSDAGLAEIRAAITERDLNRVVVASCTPRTHEPLFQATCEEAGLKPLPVPVCQYPGPVLLGTHVRG